MGTNWFRRSGRNPPAPPAPPDVEEVIRSTMHKLSFAVAPDGKTYLDHVKEEIKLTVEEALPGHWGTAKSAVISFQDRKQAVITSSTEGKLHLIAQAAVTNLLSASDKGATWLAECEKLTAEQLYKPGLATTDFSKSEKPVDVGRLQLGAIEQAVKEYILREKSKPPTSPGRG